jgi:hypothetical protein
MLGVPVFGWVIAFLVATLFAAIQYLKLIRENGGLKSLWFAAFLCRFFAWFALVLLLFNPWWLNVRQWVQSPVLLVYTDISKSIDSADRDKWHGVLEQIQKTKNVEVQRYVSADAVALSSNEKSLNPFHTNLSAVIQHASAIANNTAVAGVVCMSDGINNEGRSPQFEPLVSGVPFVMVGAGNPEPQIDAAVESVQCNDEAFLGNSFTVEVSVKSQRMKSQPLKIRLDAGGEIKEVLWSPSNDQDWRRVSFEIKPKSKGILPIKVSVQGGKGDQNLSNNVRTKYVKVVDERKKVAIVYAAPHPDVSALKTALELGGQFVVQSLPKSQSQIEADVLVLHGWKFQSQQELSKLNDWMSVGKALWLFSTDGQNAVGLSKSIGSSGDIASTRNWQEVQPHWNNAASNWGVDDKEAARWMGFPPVYSPVAEQGVPEGGEAILYQRWSGVNTQLPLLVYWKKESSAIGQFYGEGIWRWRIQEKSQHGEALAFDAWVRRTVGLLATASAMKKPLEIVLSGTSFDIRDRVIARVVCRDKSGMLDPNAERQLMLTDEKGKSRPLNLVKEEQGWVANLSGMLAGKYKLSAQSNGGKNKDEAILTLVDQPSELLNTQANHNVLRQIAKQSSGAFVGLKQADSLPQILQRLLVTKPVLKSQTQHVHWWDVWGWMLVIALLLGGEWAIRRYLGKY